jgi:hypothetical protein
VFALPGQRVLDKEAETTINCGADAGRLMWANILGAYRRGEYYDKDGNDLSMQLNSWLSQSCLSQTRRRHRTFRPDPIKTPKCLP